jgi:hypothetical protein
VSERDEFDAASEIEEQKRINRTLQTQLRRAKHKKEDLVAATLAGARDAMRSMGPVPPVKSPKKDTRKARAEIALWDLGDWQGAKRTTSYNSDVMVERVMRFCEKAVKITNIQRADHPVRECYIIFGGDMVEGLFNFAQQVFEVDQTLFGQFVTVSRLLADVVRYALANYDRVTVVSEWGNHGRIGSKRDSVPSADNVDRMCYEMARSILFEQTADGANRLTWEDCPEDIQRLEIGNYRALVVHGDEIGRNGFASPMTLVSWCVRQKSGAYPWDFQDVYSHHYHSVAEYPLPDGAGSLYQNGSTESDNRYAGVNMAASAIPSQRLHFIDPMASRVTAQYKVTLL